MANSPAQVYRINVVFIYCRDLARQRFFYEEVFALPKPVVDAKWWVEYAVGDGSHLALHQADALHFEGLDRRKSAVKFSFDVTNSVAFIERIKKAGGTLHYEGRQEYGFYLSEFEDPEGNVLRLYEKVKK